MSKRCCVCGGAVWNGRCSECGMPFIDERNRYHLNEDRSYHEEACETPSRHRKEEKRVEGSYESMMFNQNQKDIRDARKAAQSTHFGSREGTQLEREHQNERKRQSAQMRQNAQSRSDVQSGGVKGAGFSQTRMPYLGLVLVIVIVVAAFCIQVGIKIFENTGNFYSEEVTTPVEEYTQDPYEYVTRELSDTGEAYTDILSSGFYRVGWQIPEGTYTVKLESGYSCDLEVGDADNQIMIYGFFVPEDELEEQGYGIAEMTDVRLYDGAYVYVGSGARLRFSTDTAQLDQQEEPVTNSLSEHFEMTMDSSPVTYTAGEDFAPGMYDLCLSEGACGMTYERVNHREQFYFSLNNYGEDSTMKNLYFEEGDTLKLEENYTDKNIAMELIPSEYTYEAAEYAE